MAAMTRWEYRTASEAGQLDRLGGEGWELVAVTDVEGRERFYLKRPLPSMRERFTLEQRTQVLDGAGGGADG